VDLVVKPLRSMHCSTFTRSGIRGGIINATVAGGRRIRRSTSIANASGGQQSARYLASHPGWELLGDYVEPGYCEITELYQSDGWKRPF
jgi:hypothetical protein